MFGSLTHPAVSAPLSERISPTLGKAFVYSARFVVKCAAFERTTE